MEISHLEEFSTLVTYGSYTSAAKALFVSQPSLSRHVEALEKELGQDLLFIDRKSNQMTLTKAGQIVLEHASEINASFHNMLSKLDDISSMKPECIRIQNLLHLESMYDGIFEAVQNTEAQYSNVAFDYVSIDRSFSPCDAILSDQVDIAFRFSLTSEEYLSADNLDRDDEDFIHIPIFDFHGILGLGIEKSSPLLLKKELSLRDFISQPFYVPAQRHSDDLVNDFVQLCKEEGFSPIIKRVAARDQLDFYSRKPKDGVFFITRMGNDGHTAFDRYVKNNMTVILPGRPNGNHYINATLIAKKGRHSEAFSYLLEQIITIEKNRQAESLQ
ncbi:MAG: LysR family transcriptional regulator [Gordonibacter sp.]|uniref:LysR family transcriptional regulator n=1 Tax=Gordonibacter sp. TaxID=1968902 RepID=UPI002FC73A28